MEILTPYAQARKARKAAIKARKDAYDKALRAYFAARNEAIRTGGKMPNMAQFEPKESK